MSYFGILLFSLLLVFGWQQFDSRSMANVPASTIDNSYIGTTGDLVFRKGRGIWSPLFSNANADGFSHVGVIYIKDGKRYILHSEADDYTWQGGVQMIEESKFHQDSEFFTVKRNTMSAPLKQQFVDELLRLYQNKASFDNDFNLDGDPNSLYCTEYPWIAAKNIGIDFGTPIRLMGKSYITIDVLLDNRYIQ